MAGRGGDRRGLWTWNEGFGMCKQASVSKLDRGGLLLSRNNEVNLLDPATAVKAWAAAEGFWPWGSRVRR